MKLLLDSQAFILAAQDEKSLPLRSRTALLKADNSLYLSVVSIWEMQIKINLGKLHLPVSLREAVQQAVSILGLQILPIEPDHIYRLEDLPFHHRDPFDRLLIAQALAERMTLVTGDRIFARYGVHHVW